MINHGDELVLLKKYIWEKGDVVKCHGGENFNTVEEIYCISKVDNCTFVGYVPRKYLLKINRR